jgi:hypothetical protein
MTARHFVREWLAIAAVLGVALTLRLVHVISVVDFELSGVLAGLDRWLEMQIAVDVAEGDLSGGPHAIYESSPTYAVLLGVLYRLAGRNWLGPLLVQAVLGALAPLFLYAAGSRLVSARVGLLAAFLACFYGPAIFHEGLTLKFALVPVSVSALLCAAAGAAGEKHQRLWALGAGAAAAILVSLRPNAVFMLPVVAAWIVWSHRPAAAAGVILCFGAGLVTLASPVALRRTVAAQQGHAASLWGIHFYIGTVPSGKGSYVVIPEIRDNVFGHVQDARAVAEESAGKTLSPGEVSSYWLRRGLKNIREHPRAYLALEGRKLRRLLAPNEEDIFGDDYDAYADRSVVLRSATLRFGAIAPLALLGIAIAIARRSPASWCAAVAAAYATSLLVFFVTGRYRLALVPPLLICAAVALAELGDLWIGRHLITLAAALAALAFLALALIEAPVADMTHMAAVVGIGLLASRVPANDSG